METAEWLLFEIPERDQAVWNQLPEEARKSVTELFAVLLLKQREHVGDVKASSGVRADER